MVSLIHLIGIGVVVAQAWLGIVSPLTNDWRCGCASMPDKYTMKEVSYSIGVQRLLYYDVGIHRGLQRVWCARLCGVGTIPTKTLRKTSSCKCLTKRSKLTAKYAARIWFPPRYALRRQFTASLGRTAHWHGSPKLGDPDIKIAALKIWVHGRQFEDAQDYWDGNWLRVTAHCGADGGSALAHGSILHLGEKLTSSVSARSFMRQ